MSDRAPLLLLPGLLNDAVLWRHQIETLSDIAEISVGDLTRHDQLGPMARDILATAPEVFSLAGLSMGGYLALEIMRQAPERVNRLALLDTSALPDAPEQTRRRRDFIALARRGEFKGVTGRLLPALVHVSHATDPHFMETVAGMAERVGIDGFIRQQTAIMTRPDSRHDLGLIHCPTLVACGRQDSLTPPGLHKAMAAGDSARCLRGDRGLRAPIAAGKAAHGFGALALLAANRVIPRLRLIRRGTIRYHRPPDSAGIGMVESICKLLTKNPAYSAADIRGFGPKTWDSLRRLR